MISPSPRTPLASRDGCNCPAAAIRCVHWEGRVLTLVRASALDTQHAHYTVFRKPYAVTIGCPFILCHCHDQLVRFWSEPSRQFSDLPSAEAEFHRREAEMLGREVTA